MFVFSSMNIKTLNKSCVTTDFILSHQVLHFVMGLPSLSSICIV